MRESTNIVLGGAAYIMRPTFAAYGDIESRLGQKLRQVHTSVFSGLASLDEMAKIVHIGISQEDGQLVDQRTGIEITPDGIAEAIYENGAFDLEMTIQPLTAYIASLGWTPEQRKKIEAEAEAREILSSA